MGPAPTGAHRGLRAVGAGATVRLVATGVNSVGALATVVVAVRLLGTASYGELAFLLSVVALVTAMSRVGWGLATVRAVSDEWGENEADAGVVSTASSAVALSVASSVVGAAVIAAVVLLTMHDVDPRTRLLLVAGLSLLVAGANAAAASASVARGLGRMVLAEAPDLTVTVVRLSILIVLAAAGARSFGPIAVMLGTTGVAALVAAHRILRLSLPTKPRFRDTDRSAVYGLLRASIPFLVQGLAVMTVARFDVLVLGLTGSRLAVGQYEGTLRIVERVLQFLPFLLLPQYLPTATQLWRHADREAFGRLYRTVCTVCYTLAVPITVALAAFPETLLHLLYGQEFPVRPALVWILLVGFFPYAVVATSWSALASTGANRVLLRVSVLTFTVMVVTALALIPVFGGIGAAVATVVSILTHQVASAVALHRRTGVHAFDRRLLGMMAASAVLLAAAIALRLLLADAPVWSAVLCIALLGAAWLACVSRLGGVGPRGLLDAARNAVRPAQAAAA